LNIEASSFATRRGFLFLGTVIAFSYKEGKMKKLVLAVFLIVVFGFSSFANSALIDPVAYYPFNGNANDTSGNGHNGTVSGATLATDRFGNLNGAYSFNGTNNYVAIPEFLSTDISALTITAWVKPSNLHEGFIFYKGLQGELALTFESKGTYRMEVKLSDGIWFSTSGGAINAGKFQHIVGVYYKGDRIEIWVDGRLANSVKITNQNLFYGMLSSSIGSYNQATDAFFNGIIDEVAVYNRALSASEIQTLYNEVVPPPSTCFTQEQLDQAVAAANATKDAIIVQKDTIIVNLTKENILQAYDLQQVSKGLNEIIGQINTPPGKRQSTFSYKGEIGGKLNKILQLLMPPGKR